MSLRPRSGEHVPPLTAQIARASNPAREGRPEWTDLLCSTGPGGAITGGGSNPGQLATSTYEYDSWGNTTSISNSANGVTRTTDTTYDSAGRATTVAVTGGPGEPVPTTTTTTTTGYDSVTGRVLTVGSPTAGTITKAYDTLGRLISYTDADGGRTTTEYELLDRPAKVSDTVPSVLTFTYDHTAEPRCLATKFTDSVAGVFSATYDPEGSLLTEKLPGGYTMTARNDSIGARPGRRTRPCGRVRGPSRTTPRAPGRTSARRPTTTTATPTTRAGSSRTSRPAR